MLVRLIVNKVAAVLVPRTNPPGIEIYYYQGCALTAPGRLRRLTFGFGRVRKTTRSPGRALWLIVLLADKAGKNFNMLVVTVYETSEKMFFLRSKQSVQRPFHMISHVT